MKDNKKNEIREIALNLFRNHTYDSVSVNRIAKEAGISKNTFYYYFSSKEELIMGLQKLWGTSQHFGGPLWGTTHEFRRTLDIKSSVLFQYLSYNVHGFFHLYVYLLNP